MTPGLPTLARDLCALLIGCLGISPPVGAPGEEGRRQRQDTLTDRGISSIVAAQRSDYHELRAKILDN